VLDVVKFRYVEVFPDSSFDQDVFVCMENLKSSLQCSKGFWCMLLELCIVDEVNEGLDHGKLFIADWTGHDAYKNPLHFFMFWSSPLQDSRDPIFEES
jgi:hypothetical protein